MRRISTSGTVCGSNFHRRTKPALLAGVASLTIALGAVPARADCVSESEGRILCTGVTPGYVSNSDGARVTVAAGASVDVDNAGEAAIRYDQQGDLIVEGGVRSAGGAGVLLNARNGIYAIRVGAAGNIVGAQGIASAPGQASDVRIDNAGTIRGTAAEAVALESGLLGLRNRRSGILSGGVRAQSISGTNSGSIDGTTRAAIRAGAIDLTNDGVATSAATDAATITGDYVDLDNRGIVSATGGAPAIEAATLSLVNRAGGVISAQGTAILLKAQGSLAPLPDDYENQIENGGQIVGDVRSEGGARDSFYQRIGGVVSGSIDLGGGDDAYWAEGRGNTVAGGVSGSIVGGAGVDVYGIRMTQSGTVTFGGLPSGFERYGLDLCGCDVEVTIAAGTTLAYGLDLTGAGKIVNLADFNYSSTAPVLDFRWNPDSPDSSDGLIFVNRGNITANGEAAEYLIGSDDELFGQFINEGTINFAGSYLNGLRINAYAPDGGYGFVNRGAIHGNASDVESYTLNVTGDAYNSGTITAEGELGVAVISEGSGSRFTNDIGGTVLGTEVGVLLYAGSDLINRGTIEATEGSAVTVTDPWGGRRSTVINEAGGTLRAGNGVAVYGGDTPGVLVANHGRMEGGIILSGDGDDVVWLGEGSKVTGDILTGNGNDALVVDIGRASQTNGTSALNIADLVDGDVSMSANSALWLRADATQTGNALPQPVDGFERTVYEAAGAGTELTLKGPLDNAGNADEYSGRLDVAGDGRIVIDMNVNNGGTTDQSIRVEEESTATWFGDGSSGPDVVLKGSVGGGTAAVHVDATHARRFEMAAQTGAIGLVAGVGLLTGENTEVLIDAGALIRGLDSSTDYTGTLLEAGGSSIVNRGTIREMATAVASASNSMTGVSMYDYATLHNQRTDTGVGRIEMQGNAIEIESGTIINDGVISSTHGDAIRGGQDDSRVVNGARGVISGHSEGNAVGAAGAAITSDYGSMLVENAGTINGHVLLGDGNDRYVATGGTLTGDLNLGRDDDTMLLRDGATAGVTGTISGGDGRDAYGRSFTASALFNLDENASPADFELHGVEARGADTVVTVNATAPQTKALRLFGEGRIVNNADISAGNNSAIEAYGSGPDGRAQLDLVNNGDLTGDYGLSSSNMLTSFENTGQITANWIAVDIDNSSGDGKFTFRNSGGITGEAGDGVRITNHGVDEGGASVDFANSGRISSNGSTFGIGVNVDAGGDTRFANTGTIESSSSFGAGIRLAADGLIEASNGGTIRATGVGGSSVTLVREGFGGGSLDEDCIDPETGLPILVSSFVNSGTVSANAGGTTDNEARRRNLATGLYARIGDHYGHASVQNAAGGVIEATGANSVAVLIHATDGSDPADPSQRFFSLDNAGTIRGGGDTAAAANEAVRVDGQTVLGGADTVIAGGIHTIDTTDRIRNLAGGTIIGNVDLGTGDDVFENYGALDGDVRLGAGDDTFVYAGSSTFTGMAHGGDGSDILTVDASGGGSVNFDQFRGFEALTQRGTGSIAIRGTTDLGTLLLGGANVTVAAGTRFDTEGEIALSGSATEATSETINVSGTIGGSIALGAGADRVNLLAGGHVEGDIDMGAGDDYVGLEGGTLTGPIDGGEGSDTLEFRTVGSYEAPVAWNGTGYDGFERLDVSAGVLSLTGNASFNHVLISGGRLIGQAGTTITAGTIVVGQNAIFGSAGTVNGNIEVRGLLSPGASPGTMTVNGNVSFLAGSRLLLEVSNVRSDLLNISGTLNIAPGAAMDITGVLTATPGGALDLVVAQGGITGGFTTINRSETVFGFVATRGNRIQIVGEFSNNDAFGSNARNAIDYANRAVGSSQMVQAFTSALPALVGTNGQSNQAAFARLTPESYASASQLGIDNGLSIVEEVRRTQIAPPAQSGAFAFGQLLNYSSNLDGNRASGAANARNGATGVIGGLGVASEAFRVGGFIGSLDGKQDLNALGASTNTKGLIGGAFADVRIGGIGVHALVAYDGSEATTSRALPAGHTLRASYRLGGWLADLSADYRFDLGALSVAPHVGATFVQSNRGAVGENEVVGSETGNVFALDVAGDRANTVFADGGVEIGLKSRVGGMGLRSYLDIGARQYLRGHGNRSEAAGAFRNATNIGVVVANGVGRGETSARVAVGISLDLTRHIRFDSSYAAEFNGTTRQNIMGGLTIGF